MKEDCEFKDYVPGAVYRFGSIRLNEQEIIAFVFQFDTQPIHLDR